MGLPKEPGVMTINHGLKRGNLLTTLFILLGITFLAGMTAFANPADQLTMTAEQKSAVQAVIRQANEQVRQVESENQSANNPRKFRKEGNDIRAIRKKALKEIQEKLTPDQQTSIDQLLTWMQSGKEDRKEPLQSLDLTRQQKIQTARILERAQETAWETAGNSSMDFTEISRQIHQLRKDAMQSIRQQLTAKQQIKFDAWQQNSTQTASREKKEENSK